MRTQIGYEQETHQVMKLGRLQTIARIPVMPGDSIEVEINSGIRLHPLRRPGGINIRTEIYGFYAPLRWSYSAFLQAITEGWNSARAYTATQTTAWAAQALLTKNKTAPIHLMNDYANIVDHYFRERHTATINNANVLTTEDDFRYGYRAWQMPSWETGSNWADAHTNVKLPTGHPATAANEALTEVEDMPALDLARYVLTARDEQLREWDAVRIEEIHDQTYHGQLPREAVTIPELLMHQDSRMREEAHSIPGAEIQGQEITQAAGFTTSRIPRKFIPEHGTIWVLSLSRVKPTYRHSKLDFLVDNPALFGNMKLLAGHPVGNEERPYAMELRRLFDDATSSDSMGYRPYYDWWREGGGDFWNDAFYTFDKGWMPRPTPANKNDLLRHPNYDDVFLSNQFGNGRIHTNINVRAARYIGDRSMSVKMGGITGEKM